MLSKLSYAAAAPYNWSRSAISSVLGRESGSTEMEALARQLKDKETELQRAKEDRSLQEARVNELSINLEQESTENRALWDQIEYLTNQLGQERECRKRHQDMYRQEILKNQELNTMKMQLLQQVEEMQNQHRCMLSHANTTQRELESLNEEYNDLLSSYDEVYENLDSEIAKNKTLSDRVGNLTIQISQERECNMKITQQVEEIKNEQGQLKNITREYNSLLSSYNELCQEHSDFQKKYEMDVCAEQQTTARVEKKLRMVRRRYASRFKELKTQLEGSEENLESETAKNKTLYDQIKDLTSKLSQERECKMRVFQQVEETENKQRQLENLTENYNSLYSAYDELQQKYDMDLTREKERNAILEEKLKMMQKDNANRMLEKEKQEPQPLEESSFSVSQNPEQVAEESNYVPQDSKQVDEETGCTSQNPELVDEDSPSASRDTNQNAQGNGCEENAVVTTKKPSFWKRTRHLLGLRRKKNVQNVHQQMESPCVSQDQEVTAEVGEEKAVKKKHHSFWKGQEGSTSNATTL